LIIEVEGWRMNLVFNLRIEVKGLSRLSKNMLMVLLRFRLIELEDILVRGRIVVCSELMYREGFCLEHCSVNLSGVGELELFMFNWFLMEFLLSRHLENFGLWLLNWNFLN
jgi:hypothetical protein